MKAVLIFVSLLFCSVYTYSQWVDMGFPDSKVTYVRPIGDSLLYFTTSDKILTSHIGNPNWQTVLEIEEEYSVLTLDSRRFYINTNDGQFSFDRITREHTDLQLSHLDLPTMIFHSGFGLVARDTSEQAVMYSADNGLTWDTLMSIEDITTVPENSRIRKITQDIHGNLFVIYKSNWQYHLLVVSKGRRPVELTNNWYGYSDIIMDQDSTVYYTDGHGLHFLERGEKYEKDIFLEIQGDTFYAERILYADGDSIIVSSYDQVYGSGELGANGKKLFDLWQLRWASFESPGIVLGRNNDCAPFSRFTIFNLNSNRLTFDTVGLGPLFGHIDLHHLPEQPLCNTACGFYQKRYSNRHWSIERTMDDLINYTSFKDHVYARARDSIFKSANFDTWQKLDLSINVPLNSYNIRMQNIGNRQLWISDGSSTYVTTDNLNFERHPKKIKVLSS
ncbi:MAG: hypothetical protein R3275_11060, partial [Saprospiraceae bacterium]|nr:hypothetical protein [Saprospiraceae bacterium]